MPDEASELKGIHILVDGHVQGVGFRYFVTDFAQQKGLNGWVRNRWSGQVEVLAEGLPADLEALLEHVRRGPRPHLVSDVKVEWRTRSDLYDRFSILPTE